MKKRPRPFPCARGRLAQPTATRGPALAPWLALIAGVVTLVLIWPMLRDAPGAPWATSPKAARAAAVGTYVFDREHWIAAAPARPVAERLFANTSIVVELRDSDGTALVRKPDRLSAEATGEVTWQLGGPDLRFAKAQASDASLPFDVATLTEAGFDVVASGGLVMKFVRQTDAR